MSDLGDGIIHYTQYLDEGIQRELAEDVFRRAKALWLSPLTPGGQPFSVRQMNMGPLGWISDKKGYSYSPYHPLTGAPWPEMPDIAERLWRELLPEAPPPECCLINHYQGTATMGMHRDMDEVDQTTPILSISLGAPARFRIGGPKRGGKTRSVVLNSGDVIILGGASRRYYHGIDRLLPSDDLFSQDHGVEGRLNLTLRRVTSARQAVD